jgi:hypothetical protein
VRLDDLPLLPGERMLWTYRLWQGIGPFLTRNPFVWTCLALVSFRIYMQRRGGALPWDPVVVEGYAGRDVMGMLAVLGLLAMVVTQAMRERQALYFATTRRVGVSAPDGLLVPRTLWRMDPKVRDLRTLPDERACIDFGDGQVEIASRGRTIAEPSPLLFELPRIEAEALSSALSQAREGPPPG